jgi:hypothetical protein
MRVSRVDDLGAIMERDEIRQAPPSLQEVICGVIFEPVDLDAVDFGVFTTL